MGTRPFVNLYWFELERIADNDWNDPAILQAVREELCCRRSRKAKALLRKVDARLSQLSKQCFQWPSTAIMPAQFALAKDQFWYQEGLLSFLGYHVGANGAEPITRRGILDYIYNQRLPNVESVAYMQEWGAPHTGIRLKKLAETVAAFARNAKRKKANMSTAIDEWEEDLEYLRRKYYLNRWNFRWPLTN